MDEHQLNSILERNLDDIETLDTQINLLNAALKNKLKNAISSPTGSGYGQPGI